MYLTLLEFYIECYSKNANKYYVLVSGVAIKVLYNLFTREGEQGVSCATNYTISLNNFLFIEKVKVC